MRLSPRYAYVEGVGFPDGGSEESCGARAQGPVRSLNEEVGSNKLFPIPSEGASVRHASVVKVHATKNGSL